MGTTENGPPHVPRRRFTWRRFWIPFSLALAAYVGLHIWAHYQAYLWNTRPPPLTSAPQPLGNANPQTIIDRVGEPSSSLVISGSELLLTYEPPTYPVRLEFRFVNGHLVSQRIAPRYLLPVVRFLSLCDEIAMLTCPPLWLVLVIAACFHHKYERPFSHLLLATALVILLVLVLNNPLNPGAWLFYTIPVALGVLAIRSSRRTPQDEDTPACEECGYNLTGNISGICPECGMTVPQELRETSAGEARP
jgi:hypothetical protein